MHTFRRRVPALASFLPLAPAQAADRPNFVFFLTDNQPYPGLSCTGDSSVQTPAMDQLAADGNLFENAFATTAICCGSRANILTGQWLMYEESIRVPLIVADPRLPAATRGRRTAMALTLDLGADPRGEKNLATAPAQRPTLARLRARCEELRISLQ